MFLVSMIGHPKVIQITNTGPRNISDFFSLTARREGSRSR